MSSLLQQPAADRADDYLGAMLAELDKLQARLDPQFALGEISQRLRNLREPTAALTRRAKVETTGWQPLLTRMCIPPAVLQLYRRFSL